MTHALISAAAKFPNLLNRECIMSCAIRWRTVVFGLWLLAIAASLPADEPVVAAAGNDRSSPAVGRRFAAAREQTIYVPYDKLRERSRKTGGCVHSLRPFPGIVEGRREQQRKTPEGRPLHRR